MERYEDILYIPHHQSTTRAHMPIASRAVQFAPFAALTGYDSAVRETARLTDGKPTLAEEKQEELSQCLGEIHAALPRRVPVQLTFFVPDGRKAGGSIRTLRTCIRKIDPISQTVVLDSRELIPMDDLLGLTILE